VIRQHYEELCQERPDLKLPVWSLLSMSETARIDRWTEEELVAKRTAQILGDTRPELTYGSRVPWEDILPI